MRSDVWGKTGQPRSLRLLGLSSDTTRSLRTLPPPLGPACGHSSPTPAPGGRGPRLHLAGAFVSQADPTFFPERAGLVVIHACSVNEMCSEAPGPGDGGWGEGP